MNFEQILLRGRHSLGEILGCIYRVLVILVWAAFVSIVELLVQNSCISNSGVELDPVRRKHKVHETVVSVAPEFDYPSKLELADNIVGFDQGVHVSFQT